MQVWLLKSWHAFWFPACFDRHSVSIHAAWNHKVATIKLVIHLFFYSLPFWVRFMNWSATFCIIVVGPSLLYVKIFQRSRAEFGSVSCATNWNVERWSVCLGTSYVSVYVCQRRNSCCPSSVFLPPGISVGKVVAVIQRYCWLWIGLSEQIQFFKLET